MTDTPRSGMEITVTFRANSWPDLWRQLSETTAGAPMPQDVEIDIVEDPKPEPKKKAAKPEIVTTLDLKEQLAEKPATEVKAKPEPKKKAPKAKAKPKAKPEPEDPPFDDPQPANAEHRLAMFVNANGHDAALAAMKGFGYKAFKDIPKDAHTDFVIYLTDFLPGAGPAQDPETGDDAETETDAGDDWDIK